MDAHLNLEDITNLKKGIEKYISVRCVSPQKEFLPDTPRMSSTHNSSPHNRKFSFAPQPKKSNSELNYTSGSDPKMVSSTGRLMTKIPLTTGNATQKSKMPAGFAFTRKGRLV